MRVVLYYDNEMIGLVVKETQGNTLLPVSSFLDCEF